MLDCGSSGIIQRVSPGVALKQLFVYLGQTEVDERVANCFSVEKQILKRLGHHPRIIPRTSGRWYSPSRGQPWQPPGYLDSHPSASLGQRLAWCRQVAEAIDYIHSCGVVHSDLRPGNILVHETTPGARDLQLCDFGGSVCQELGLDGFSLPDGPFYSPVFENKTSTLLDIFGIGSIFYTILTGRWPYKTTPGRFAKVDDRLDWEERIVYPNFKAGKFPDVEQLPGGGVILKCWMRQYATAREALSALEEALPGTSSLSIHDGLDNSTRRGGPGLSDDSRDIQGMAA